jgi:hypothetical protein
LCSAYTATKTESIQSIWAFGSLIATQATKQNANDGFSPFDTTQACQRLHPESQKKKSYRLPIATLFQDSTVSMALASLARSHVQASNQPKFASQRSG